MFKVVDMIPQFKDDELQQTKKEESVPNGTSTKSGNTKTLLSSSRQWSSAFRNPRIVRVSRSFGGKDRHSKVCTVRGLRDRRIRLSVPTAIQLYDLQERLGLSQPSKVIDWLMDSTKDDIDKLPPLQLPQGSFGQFLQQSIIGAGGLASSHNDQIDETNSYNYPIFIDGNASLFSSKDVGSNRSRYWDYLDAASKAKRKEIERDNELNLADKVSWMEMNSQNGLNHLQGLRGYNNNQVAAQNFFPIASDDHSTYNPNYNHNWDQLNQSNNNNHNNDSSLLRASSSSTFGGPQQLFFSPPSTSTRYPSYSTTSLEAATGDQRQINSHFHNLFSPSSMKTFQQPNNAKP